VIGLPLLHAGQSTAVAGVLDARVVSVAILAFVLVAALIWLPVLPEPAVLARSVFSRRVARRFAAVLAALALLPAVLPYDHLLPGLHVDVGADEAVHASHCHVSPGSCSDVPLASGFGEFVFNEPLVLIPAMLTVALFAITQVLRGSAPRPDVPPPQHLAVA
jgi:hypothetical protein